MELQFSQTANKDLDRLFAFLINNKASLQTADKALLSIKAGALALLENPLLGTSLDDAAGRRELYIKFGQNAYIIRYAPDMKAQVIRVLRIWHGREER